MTGQAIAAVRPAPAGGGGAGRAERSEALGKYADNSSPAGQADRQGRRNEAWAVRRRLWELSSLPRVRACGRVTHAEESGPTLRTSGQGEQRRAGFAGLVTCGSPWACPCCARKIGARRADEIREVVAAADAAGGMCGLITLTLRHNRGHRLADAWDALRYAWGCVTSGKAYQRERQQFGIEGWVAAVEVTRSDAHGWHPHLHVIVVLDGPMSHEMLAELGGRWFARWERALARREFSALEFDGGLDVRTVAADSSGALGRYLSKLALEVAGGTNKTARRRGSRTPFAILADGLSTGLADDIESWWEYEKASHGRRQVTFSRGLRERYRLAVEESDEEIASEDMGGDDLVALPIETWRAVRGRAEVLLSLAEQGGVDAVIGWLRERGLAWHRSDDEHKRARMGRRVQQRALSCTKMH